MAVLDQETDLLRRHLYFLTFAVASSLAFLGPLKTVLRFALAHDYDSHILIIIPISAYLIFRKRHEVFSSRQWGYIPGTILFVVGVAFGFGSVRIAQFRSDEYVWMRMLALVILWIAGFIFFYGLSAFRAARFPLMFLFLLLPVPNFLVERAISLLQQGSAFVAFWLFKLLNVPVMREGLVFHIPSLDLEVSKECSGIHSSVVLLLTTVLIGEFVLRSVWRKSVLVMLLIPVVILKNGLRIVTISLLTVYVSRSFLHGWLHHSGGIVFYLLGLLVLLVLLKLLKRSEIRMTGSDRIVAGSAVKQTPERGGAI